MFYDCFCREPYSFNGIKIIKNLFQNTYTYIIKAGLNLGKNILIGSLIKLIIINRWSKK